MKSYDTHAHIFTKDLPRAKDSRYSPDYDVTPQDYIAHLDKHHIDCGVLVQVSFLGNDNSYMWDAMKKYPLRFKAIAVVEPSTSYEVLKEMHKSGFTGARLNLDSKALPDLRSHEYQTFFANLKKLDWHIELHNTDLKALVPTLLEAGLKVVVDHYGRPKGDNPLEDENLLYLLELGETKRVWVKLSAPYRIDKNIQGYAFAKSAIPLFLEKFEHTNLLWGSDWPHTQYEDVTDYDSMYQQIIELVDKDILHIMMCKAPELLFSKVKV